MPSIIKENNLEVVPSDTDHVANGTVNGGTTEKPKPPSSNISIAEEENSCNPNEDFEIIENDEQPADECTFSDLIKKMRDSQYQRNLDEANQINAKCKLLFQRDYKVEVVVTNACINYPKEILVPVGMNDDKETSLVDFDVELYKELVSYSATARIRSRFVVPVILLNNKFICRSGTLCVWISALYENVKASIPSIPSVSDFTEAVLNPTRSMWSLVSATYTTVQLLISDYPLRVQYAKDAEILKHLKVDRICDFMVELYKHFKDILNVSSTEKNNEDIYKGMKIEEMPYPGCEFFTRYFEAGKIPDALLFNWNQSDVTRALTLTENPKFFPDMDIDNFKRWDLVHLTQNYLKIILSYLVTGTGGILVHCISGWDRTPLFVSLIRLSLWADGVIHQSLNPEDMAYLTVAYDWFLFGHNLPDRLSKKEEVMHFCFNFLQHITSDEFSVTRMVQELAPEIKNGTFPEFVPGRRATLNDIRTYVMNSYEAHIPKPENE